MAALFWHFVSLTNSPEGLGKNMASRTSLQLGENTIQVISSTLSENVPYLDYSPSLLLQILELPMSRSVIPLCYFRPSY